MAAVTGEVLKARVKGHWEAETCGIRYGDGEDRVSFFDEISRARYELEPYIPPFASFSDADGKSVLEIGVGAGSDFEQWCHHARHATGVDLTDAAIALTSERLGLRGMPEDRYTLLRADAENLPFDDDTFDIVYSWGVLHHTPDTSRAFAEVRRVLRPGGSLRAMIYHIPSWGGLVVTASHAVKGRTLRVGMRSAIFENLESPGTKAYTIGEARRLLEAVGLSDISVRAKLSTGDLLTMKLSSRYDTGVYRVVQRLYPRWLVRRLGDRFGLNMLVEASKAK